MFLLAVYPRVKDDFKEAPGQTNSVSVYVSFVPVDVTVVACVLVTVKQRPYYELGVYSLAEVENVVVEYTRASHRPIYGFYIRFDRGDRLFVIVTGGRAVLFRVANQRVVVRFVKDVS